MFSKTFGYLADESKSEAHDIHDLEQMVMRGRSLRGQSGRILEGNIFFIIRHEIQS